MRNPLTPLLQTRSRKVSFDQLLRHHIAPHGKKKHPTANNTLTLILFYITRGHQPLL